MPTSVNPNLFAFMRLTDTTTPYGPANACWRWVGKLNNKGYGITRRMHCNYAHRLSYTLFVGPVPARMCVLHKCDVPDCVNPRHLRLGTQLENIQDCVTKKRHAHGERSGRSKLRLAEVLEMRARRDAGAKLKTLAAAYKVSVSLVSHICAHHVWRV